MKKFLDLFAAGTGLEMFKGLNVENVRLIQDQIPAGGTTNTSNFTTTMPADMLSKDWAPLAIRVLHYGSGAIGARTVTPYPESVVASDGVKIVSYVESTGVLTMTNNTGITLSAGDAILILMVGNTL